MPNQANRRIESQVKCSDVKAISNKLRSELANEAEVKQLATCDLLKIENEVLSEDYKHQLVKYTTKHEENTFKTSLPVMPSVINYKKRSTYIT